MGVRAAFFVRHEHSMSTFKERCFGMDWRSVKFCPSLAAKKSGDGKLSYDSVAAILAGNLFAGCTKAKELLCARYRQMVENYLNVPHDDTKWDLKMGSKRFKREGKDEAALLPVPQNVMPGCHQLVSQLWSHPDFGHDMPTWMVKRGVKNPPRVMIVSQDPLRTDQKDGNLVLSTPFGFHSADYRNVCCQNPILCRMVERLIEECDACVYLTDCMKFYTSDKFVERHLSRFRQMFDEVLRMEKDTFAPDAILTLGNIAADFCHVKPPRDGYRAQDVDACKFIASYHTGVRPAPIRKFVPSGSTNRYFKLVFEEVCSALQSLASVK